MLVKSNVENICAFFDRSKAMGRRPSIWPHLIYDNPHKTEFDRLSFPPERPRKSIDWMWVHYLTSAKFHRLCEPVVLMRLAVDLCTRKCGHRWVQYNWWGMLRVALSAFRMNAWLHKMHTVKLIIADMKLGQKASRSLPTWWMVYFPEFWSSLTYIYSVVRVWCPRLYVLALR